ncbi:E3 ISG15--protein ligase HERC5-like [Clytia hemisphaerica]|uniref:E3 ISG15--protein ligase HERC5-like n=1 Tax=Clytia hemisphaerica TaxID=252671 RepID=UPI0034D61B35
MDGRKPLDEESFTIGHYCGYFDGELHKVKFQKPNSGFTDNILRTSKGLNFPVKLELNFKNISSFCLSQGKIYYLDVDNNLMKLSPRGSPRKIHLNLGEGRQIEKIFVEPVHETLILLVCCKVFNVRQQEVVRWRDQSKLNTTEEDLYSFDVFEENEIVEYISGTDTNGFVLTNLGRIWKIENWNSRSSTWALTVLPYPSRISQIRCGKEHLIALTKEGQVLTMGKSTRGQLGQGSTASHDTLQPVEVLEPLRFVQVAAGGWHSLVLSDSGDIYGWGWNESGQVGIHSDHNTNNRTLTKEDIPKLIFSPTLLDTPLDVTFQTISTGSRHSAGITTDGSVYFWGWNEYGQLMDQTNQYILIPTKNNTVEMKRVVCEGWSTLMFS